MKFILYSILLFIPLVSLADFEGSQISYSSGMFGRLVMGIVSFLGSLFLAGGVVTMLYAGYVFFYANGEVEKVTEARKNLIWGIIGLIVGLSAYIAPELVKNLLQGSS
ncbi:MAG: hypothetical protein HZA36_03065 [Parcubacteria group bacterium]|nr:hypothetical protein [Parcubacteria group bacterium]